MELKLSSISFETCKFVNKYWTRGAVGIMCKKEGKDAGTLSCPGATNVPVNYRMAAAIHAALACVTCLPQTMKMLECKINNSVWRILSNKVLCSSKCTRALRGHMLMHWLLRANNQRCSANTLS